MAGALVLYNNTKYENTGLGDYIHFHKKNYIRYGIYRNFGARAVDTAANSAQKAWGELREQIAYLQYPRKADNIQKFLNAALTNDFTSMKKINPELQETDKEKMEQELVNALKNNFKTALVDFDRTTLGFNSNRTIGLGVQTYKGITAKGEAKTQAITFEKMASISKSLDRILNTIQHLTSDDLRNLDEVFEEGINDIEDIRNIVNQAMEAIRKRTSHLDDAGRARYQSKFKDNLSLFNALSTFNNIARYLKNPTSVINGEIGEYSVAAFLSMMGSMANQVSEDMLKESVVGTTEKIPIMYDGISNLYVDKTIMINTMNTTSNGRRNSFIDYQVQDGNIVAMRTNLQNGNNIKYCTQGTVDVRVNIGTSFNPDIINASIKNYESVTTYFTSRFNKQQYGGVSIVSGTNLLQVLSILKIDFGNHYLNLISNSSDKDMEDKDEKDVPILKAILKDDMNPVVKYALAVRGLAGVRKRTANANSLSQFFIVNSRAENRIRVYSTGNILNQLCSSYNGFRDDLAELSGNLPAFGSIKNDFEEGGTAARIAKVIAATHKYKLSMTLKPEFFINIPSGA